MNKRDTAILDDLKKFKVLSRDQLIKLHFSDNKQPHIVANRVLKRLTDRQYIDVSKEKRQYEYFPLPRPMRKDSTKIPHFKAIADFYINACQYAQPSQFIVEFKPMTKGGIEPDIFMKWKYNGKLLPYLVEIQRNIYSKKQIQNKMNLYREYYESDIWRQYSKNFPIIWIITDKEYDIDTLGMSVIQTKDLEGISNYL